MSRVCFSVVVVCSRCLMFKVIWDFLIGEVIVEFCVDDKKKF